MDESQLSYSHYAVPKEQSLVLFPAEQLGPNGVTYSTLASRHHPVGYFALAEPYYALKRTVRDGLSCATKRCGPHGRVV